MPISSACKKRLPERAVFFIGDLSIRAVFFFADDVVSAAFYDGSRRDESQLRLFLKLRDGDSAAVAHGGFDLSAGLFDVFFQRTGIWDIGVYAFFESELLGTIEVITAPVSGTV